MFYADFVSVSAFVGQTRTQTPQEMQWPGRASCGNGPAISRQSVGQSRTHHPQPLQSRSSSVGNSRRGAAADFFLRAIGGYFLSSTFFSSVFFSVFFVVSPRT